MKKVCVAIPVYKETPDRSEILSISRCTEVFSGRDIFFICPEGLSMTRYPELPKIRFERRYFLSLRNYSELCCTPQFYRSFADYDYVLVYQPDCWVFEDRLDGFTSLGYDYIGAPWYGVRNIVTGQRIPEGTVGNGGLSLRRVSTFLGLAQDRTPFLPSSFHPEDIYWCIWRAGELNIAPEEVARTFSLEHHPEVGYARNGNKLPMGCHKPWQLRYFHSFWKEFIPDCR